MGHYYIQKAQKAWRDVLPVARAHGRQHDKPTLAPLSKEEARRHDSRDAHSDRGIRLRLRNRAICIEILAACTHVQRGLRLDILPAWRVDLCKAHGVDNSAIGALLGLMGFKCKSCNLGGERRSIYSTKHKAHEIVDKHFPE